MKSIIAVLGIAACGGAPPIARPPDGDPLPKSAPLPPVESADGLYVDPDAHFSVQLPPGSHFSHGTSPALNNGRMVSAATDQGNVSVLYFKPFPLPSVQGLDNLLQPTDPAAPRLVISDLAIPGATHARFHRYSNPPGSKVKGSGETRAILRDPWVYVVFVFAQPDTPFEQQAASVLESFKLLPIP